MNPSPAHTLHDADLLKAGDALRRAAANAQQLALATGTPCYVWQGGKIVNIGLPPKVGDPTARQPARV